MDPVSAVLNGISIGGARGRKAQPLLIEFVRELQASDLDLILSPPAQGVKTPFIQRIRHTHHALARLIASGKKDAEIHLITGYSASRISILKGDPAFKELIAYYSAQREDAFVDAQKRLADLGITTLEELEERITSEPEKFSNGTLLELAKMCFDRSVAPAKTGQGAAGGGNAPPVRINVSFVAGPAGLPPPPMALGGSGPLIELQAEAEAEDAA